MSSILRAQASARLFASLASPPHIILWNPIRVLSTGTTPPPGPEAAASASSAGAGGKARESWWTKAKPGLFGGLFGGTVTGVISALGIYLGMQQHERDQPQYKAAQAKKSVEAAFNRPPVPILSAADLGEATIKKGDRPTRPDIMFNPTNVKSVPKLQWNQEGLKTLLVESGIIFVFKESGSGKTTSVQAMVNALNGLPDKSGKVHRFLFVPLRDQKTANAEGACMSINEAFAKACGIDPALTGLCVSSLFFFFLLSFDFLFFFSFLLTS